MDSSSWLEEEDIERIWNLVHGNGREDNTTAEELAEFQRLIDSAIAKRTLN